MIQSLFQGVFDWLNSTYIEPSIKALKLRAAIGYLEVVKSTHQILFLVCMLVFVITLIGAGLVILPIAILLFMPWDPGTKVTVGMIIGALYLLVPIGTLATLLSEKRWMRLTGATNLLRRIVE